MSLDHALLTSLLERPSAGYDLARRFDRSIGHFWHATHQQIYKVLARMETAGWVSSEIQAGASAPDRKVFTVTEAGRAALGDWLQQTSEPESGRSALMVKLRAAAFGDPQQLHGELAHHLACHQQMLAQYRRIAADDFSGPLDRQGQLQQQVLQFGLAYETTWINWCREAQALLDRISHSNPSAPEAS